MLALVELVTGSVRLELNGGMGATIGRSERLFELAAWLPAPEAPDAPEELP